MKDCQSFALPGISKSRRRRLAALIALLLLATFLGRSYLCNEGSRKSGAGKQGSDTTVTHPSESDFYYFRSGMWLADLRTFVAACQYVMQPDWG